MCGLWSATLVEAQIQILDPSKALMDFHCPQLANFHQLNDTNVFETGAKQKLPGVFHQIKRSWMSERKRDKEGDWPLVLEGKT